MKLRQQGFTLIELIMVIVILGILAATALPRFANLSTDARVAKMEGALGAARSASAITHAAWLATGGTSSAVKLEGQSIALAFGYPTDAAIYTAAGISTASGSGFAVGASNGIVTDESVTTCSFTYAQPTTSSSSPTFSSAISTANCGG